MQAPEPASELLWHHGSQLHSGSDQDSLFSIARCVRKTSGELTTGTLVDTIMFHFSSEVPERPDAPYDPERIIEAYRKDGVSAHYLINRQGKIYRLVDERRRAYHAGSRTTLRVETAGSSQRDARAAISPQRSQYHGV